MNYTQSYWITNHELFVTWPWILGSGFVPNHTLNPCGLPLSLWRNSALIVVYKSAVEHTSGWAGWSVHWKCTAATIGTLVSTLLKAKMTNGTQHGLVDLTYMYRANVWCQKVVVGHINVVVRNDCWKFSFTTGLNYIFKYIYVLLTPDIWTVVYLS